MESRGHVTSLAERKIAKETLSSLSLSVGDLRKYSCPHATELSSLRFFQEGDGHCRTCRMGDSQLSI